MARDARCDGAERSTHNEDRHARGAVRDDQDQGDNHEHDDNHQQAASSSMRLSVSSRLRPTPVVSCAVRCQRFSSAPVCLSARVPHTNEAEVHGATAEEEGRAAQAELKQTAADEQRRE